jgi:peptidoglycan/xylan/chitin deacetylase (PgdA/CDA1 family)
MRLFTPEEIEAMLSALASWSNYSHQEGLISRPLTTAELRKLAGDELITVGSHTITHPPLKMIPLAQQEAEIQRSKADLENIIHQPATSFSYPFGLSTDYSTLSVNLVRDAGYILACTNEMDAVWYGSDPFQLPRLWAKDLSGEAFAHYLNRWLM